MELLLKHKANILNILHTFILITDIVSKHAWSPTMFQSPSHVNTPYSLTLSHFVGHHTPHLIARPFFVWIQMTALILACAHMHGL